VKQLPRHVLVGVAGKAVAQLGVLERRRSLGRIARPAGQRNDNAVIAERHVARRDLGGRRLRTKRQDSQHGCENRDCLHCKLLPGRIIRSVAAALRLVSYAAVQGIQCINMIM
jgi:hypothetical protein